MSRLSASNDVDDRHPASPRSPRAVRVDGQPTPACGFVRICSRGTHIARDQRRDGLRRSSFTS
jgi:hypothetical protein